MNKLNDALRKMTKTLIENALTSEPREWPPSCFFAAYQPERPQSVESKEASKAE